jgi:hypothetical protein
MPPSSPLPPLVGLVAFAGFMALLLAHFLIAAGLGGLAAALLVAWHLPPHREGSLSEGGAR